MKARYELVVAKTNDLPPEESDCYFVGVYHAGGSPGGRPAIAKDHVVGQEAAEARGRKMLAEVEAGKGASAGVTHQAVMPIFCYAPTTRRRRRRKA